MKKLCSLMLLIGFPLLMAAQMPCSAPGFRQFDFWVGEWEVWGKGKMAGSSKISVMLDSCVIFEEWTSVAPQQGLVYTGKSFNTYNARTNEWEQFWTDNTGTTVHYEGGKLKDNVLSFQTRPFTYQKDTIAVRRLSFFKLGEDKVRQLFERSVDKGVSWVVEFDLEYRRKKKY